MSDSSYDETSQDLPIDGSVPPNKQPLSDEEKEFLDNGDSLMLNFRGRMIFRAYPYLPSRCSGSEKDVYASLAPIANAMCIPGLISERQLNDFHYRDFSTKCIASEIEGSNNKIDAGFIRGASSMPATQDIAVVIEQKLLARQRAGNNRQAVSANVQIMNDDVRRMFTFGITIDSDQVTLWYHSRSHSAISEQFSIVQHPRLLLKVFASFLYANTEQLGYDPLVDYLGEGRYIFKNIPNVNNPSVLELYLTVNTISELRANNTTGRMSRFFTVVKYDEKNTDIEKDTRYVLKDVWLDEHAKTERELQTNIFEDINDFWKDDTTPARLNGIKKDHQALVSSEAYKNFFLSIEGDYHGRISKPLLDDFQPVRGLLVGPALEDEQTEPASNIGRRPEFETNHTMPLTTGLGYDDFAPEEFARTYSSKRQYRVVFHEVCNSVGHLNTLGEVIDVLRQSLIPLQLMLCAGWVHRDISSGNIMAYRRDLNNTKEPWRVILADLEYAKKYPEPNREASYDPKTGTPFFMPTEIMMCTTLFERDYEDSFPSSKIKSEAAAPAATVAAGQEDEEEDLYERSKIKVVAREKSGKQGIVYNFQHDIESIWWIILWTITSRIAWVPAQAYADKIFQNTIKPSGNRIVAFRKGVLQDLNSCLSKNLAEDSAEPMEIIRTAMYQAYVSRVRESKLEDMSSFVSVSNAFGSFFRDLGNRDRWSSTRLSAQNPYINQAERKRPRPDDDDDRHLEQEEMEPKSKMAKTGDVANGKKLPK